jgi:hypothetical protein
MKVIVLVQQILCVVLFSNSLSLESLAMDLPSGSVLEKTLVKFCNENFASDQLLVPILGARLASWDFQHSSKMSS